MFACTVNSASITHLAGIQLLASWIQGAVSLLSSMRHNEHNILHRYGHVFVGRAPSIHSSIWSYRVWWLGGILQRARAAAVVAGLRVWVWAAALFRATGGRQIHCTHLRKGHTEKRRTNCISIPLLMLVTTIRCPVCDAGGPVWTLTLNNTFISCLDGKYEGDPV